MRRVLIEDGLERPDRTSHLANHGVWRDTAKRRVKGKPSWGREGMGKRRAAGHCIWVEKWVLRVRERLCKIGDVDGQSNRKCV